MSRIFDCILTCDCVHPEVALCGWQDIKIQWFVMLSFEHCVRFCLWCDSAVVGEWGLFFWVRWCWFFLCVEAKRQSSNKPKELAQQEKKQELENRLRGVQEQLGQTVKKPNKKGKAEMLTSFLFFVVSLSLWHVLPLWENHSSLLIWCASEMVHILQTAETRPQEEGTHMFAFLNELSL